MKFALVMLSALIGYAAHAEFASHSDEQEILDLLDEPALLSEETSNLIAGQKLLADVTVGDSKTRLAVSVANCGEDITHLKLKVSGSDMAINGAGVIFKDGTSKTYGISKSFQNGYESSWISLSLLRPAGRCVKSVYVNAKSLTTTRARAQVFGQTK